MLVYGAWPVSDLWLHNDYNSSDRACSSTQHYRGQEINQIVTCKPREFCGLLQESGGKSPSVAMVLLYHIRDKGDWYKKLGGECILLDAEKSWVFLHYYSKEHDKEENKQKKILPQAFHFLLNFLCTMTLEVLNSSGSFILWPCKVCRQVYSREKETYWIAVSAVTNLKDQINYLCIIDMQTDQWQNVCNKNFIETILIICIKNWI